MNNNDKTNLFYIKHNGTTVFKSIAEAVGYLERVVVRERFHQSRSQWMQTYIDLGHGYDDAAGKTFTELMANWVEIGIIKENGPVRCNIHEAMAFKNEAFGD